MAGKSENSERGIYTYHIRIMGGIIVAELLFLALVLFWPVPDKEQIFQDIYDDSEEVAIQAPVRTRQQSSPPPPPAPRIPVPVPNDEPIEEEDIEFTDEIFSDSYDTLSTTAGVGGEQGRSQVVGNPSIGPRAIRIVEPSLEGRKGNKYEITVEFLVDKEGDVEEAVIMHIYQIDKDGNQIKEVQSIDNYLVEEIIKAALNWKFRPAQNNGEPVRAYTKNFFTI